MALVYVGGMKGNRAGSTSAGLTLDLTTISGGVGSITAGDLVVVVIATGSVADRSVGMATPSTGWTERENYANSTTDCNMVMAYRFHQGGDTTSYVTDPSGNNADGLAAAVHVWRGVHANVIDVSWPSDFTATNTGRPTPPAITPSTTGAVILCGGAAGNAAGAVFTASQLSNLQTDFGSDTYDGTAGLASYAWTSGTFTPNQWGGSTTGSGDSCIGMTMALKPDALNYSYTGAVAGTGTWSSQKSGEVTITGAVAGVGSLLTYATREKIIAEALSPGVYTYQSSYEKTVAGLEYTHTGAIAAVDSWVSDRSREKAIQGSVAAVDSWVSERTVTIVRTGNIAAVDSWVSDRSREKTIQGSVAAVGTWVSDRSREKAFQGSIAAIGTWVSGSYYEPAAPAGVDYTYTGAVASAQTWASRLRLPVMLSDSTYISAGTEATTNRLSTYHAGGDFVAGKISDDTNPLPSISLGSGKFTEIEYSLYIDGAGNDVFHFRVTPVGVYTVDPQFTVGAVDYVHTGAVASVQEWKSDRAIDITRIGAVAAIETWSHQRFIDKQFIGAIAAVDSWLATRAVEIVRTGSVSAQEWWDSYYAGALKDYLWQGTVLAVETWDSPHPVEIQKPSTIAQTNTWASEKYHERPLVTGAIAAVETWASSKTIEKFVSGAISQIDTWSHTRNIVKLVTGAVWSNWEWQAYFEGTLLQFVHEGATTTEYTWDHSRYILKNIFGLVSAEETWLSDRMKSFTHQGAFNQIDTWSHIRNIERVKEGAVYSTETWSHIVGRQMVYIGTINGEDTWVSQKGIHKIITGEISWQEFWESLIGVTMYMEPSDIFRVPAREGVAYAPARTANASAGARVPDATVTKRTDDARYTG